MQRLVPLAVALIAVTAGCIGGPIAPGATDASPTGTTSPTDASPTTDEPSPSSTPETEPSELNGTLAPGVTANGIENASALLDAHVDELLEAGFELDVDRRVRHDGETYVVDRRIVTRPNLDVLSTNVTAELPDGQTFQRSWLGESAERMIVEVVVDGETSYRIPPVGPADSEGRTYYAREYVEERQLADLLDGGEFEVTKVDESDGERRYTLAGANFTTDGPYGEREVQLIVDGDGVFHELEANGSLSAGESFEYDYSVERLGVESVDRPGWVEDAPEPIDTRPTAGFENCTSPYLTLGNEDPDAVPAGTVVTVTLNGTEYEATLDAALETGERRALYLDDSGELTVTDVDSVPANRTAMPNEAQVRIVTGEGLLLTNGAMGFGCESVSEGGTGSGSTGGSSGSDGSNSDGPADG